MSGEDIEAKARAALQDKAWLEGFSMPATRFKMMCAWGDRATQREPFLAQEVLRLRAWLRWIGTVAREHVEMDFDRRTRDLQPMESEDGGSGWARFAHYLHEALSGSPAPEEKNGK